MPEKVKPSPNSRVLKTSANHSKTKTLTILPLEKKIQLVNKVEELTTKGGLSVRAAMVKAGLTQAQYYGYRNQIARKNGALPVKTPKDMQILNFNLGGDQAEKGPLILAMGNPQDVNKALEHLASIFRRS